MGKHIDDPIDLFMIWYNTDRHHMSLDWDNLQTSVPAFVRKIPESEITVIDS